MNDALIAYRSTFSTGQGRRVLAHMLAEAKFFDTIKTPEEVAVENFMKKILSNLGVWNLDNAEGVANLIIDYLPTELKNE